MLKRPKRYIGKRRNYNTWPWKTLFAVEAAWEWFTALFRRQPKIVDKTPNPFGQYWKA